MLYGPTVIQCQRESSMPSSQSVSERPPTATQSSNRPSLATILSLIATACVFALAHPFVGLLGDSKIYLGRALADIDPTGVGRDMMFRLDGQSAFSLFPVLARALVSYLSPLATAKTLVAIGMAFWFSAFIWFVSRAAPRRIWLIALVAMLTPSAYGPYNLLRYAEALAEPRPFSEALTILALGAILAGRKWIASALLVCAAALHPIMALAGMAAFSIYLCLEDRRWLAAAAALAAAIAIAAAYGAPVVERLFVTIDPAWLSILLARNSYLFPHAWPVSAWSFAALQASTVAFAAALAPPRLRRLLVAVLLAGVAGLAVGWLCGGVTHNLLIIQAQTWRMWWLVGFLAAVSLGLTAERLGRGDASDRVALACLATAWICTRDIEFLSLALVGVSAFVALRPQDKRLDFSDRLVRIVWIALALAVGATCLWSLRDIGQFADYFQPGFQPQILQLASTFVIELVRLAAIALAAFGAPVAFLAVAPAARIAATAGLALVAIAVWDDATSYDRSLARAERQTGLESLMPERRGETLWLGGATEPWFWLGRPNWGAEIQGAGIVFSRALALAYEDRARFQMRVGIAGEEMMGHFAHRRQSFFADLKEDAVAAVCQRSDGPTYIVAPVRNDAVLAPELKARRWQAPAARIEALVVDDQVKYERIEKYAVISCGDHRGARQ